ncbi:cysteine peptidase inhibitor [Trypanosoma conorhini]|uniref:Cysteine peptidase inhibitor n=1 Tax=Trypanosoma conorhini TaxID=83891 RepID=A0A3R7NCH5_9TRYP|nr:cysteine peptidase inhibitor [Trypanosoma conorhini]RNF20035.1 cysteine peptidase inhibitor [Trypanosoma conorhini]
MPKKLTRGDHGKTVTLTVGETVEIELPSNPSTGFSWMFENRKKEPENKALTVANFYAAPDAKLIGAGGTELFKVTPTAPGLHEVTLVYMRPWVGPRQDSERYTVQLKAK